MTLRDCYDRLKGKLKKRWRLDSRERNPTSSSANPLASAMGTNTARDSTASPVPGQVTPKPPPTSEITNLPLPSTPQVDSDPQLDEAVLPGPQPSTESNDEHNSTSHTQQPLTVSQPRQVATSGAETGGQPTDDTKVDEQAGKASLVWTASKALLRVVNGTADVFPPLKAAVGELNECINIYEEAKQGCKDYDHQLSQVRELLEELQEHIQSGTIEMTQSVERICCELELEVKTLQTKTQGPEVERWLRAMDASEEITKCHDRIQRLLERLTFNAAMKIIKQLNWQDHKIDNMDERFDKLDNKFDLQDMERRLDRLSPAREAIYNSAASDNVRRAGCTSGTREPQINSILEWTRASKAGKTYWMNGMAGTGKTTIAYSVCTRLNATSKQVQSPEDGATANRDGISMLGASFFCSRDMPECRQVKNIIPTIAYQLSCYSSPFRYALHKVLRADADVHTRALKIQFAKLIVEPMMAVKDSLPTDFIVIIDALDECENVNSLREILSLLLSTPNTLPIRFLVSSRPEPEISRQMDGQVNEQGNTLLVLHNLDIQAVKSDIEVFMRHELQSIPLTRTQWSGLLERCGALFIYASTACRFIRNGNEFEALDEAVNAITSQASTRMECGDEPIIDELYITILRMTFAHKSNMPQKDKRQMRDILETVICAAQPMSLVTVARLLGLTSPKRVTALLRPLRSVLNMTPETELVTTLHASFPDFMFSQGRSKEFHCEQKPRNVALAKACLDTIRTIEPAFNICALSSSYPADDQVSDLEERVKDRIAPGLGYACRYWSIHLNFATDEDQLVDFVSGFFTKQLLVWMEVLNLTKQIRLGSSIIQHAERWCLDRHVDESVLKLARDASQFVSVYANHPVSQSTPHIYVSMLPFWPKSRPVSTTYMTRTTGMIKPKGTAIDRRQPALLATWRVANEPVWSMSLSKDGTRIVAASDNIIIMLDTSTGEETLRCQEPRTEGVCTVAMSPDGSRVAFGSDSGAYLLEVASGQVTELCPEQISGILCIAFSYDGSRIAVCTQNGSVFIFRTQQADLVLGPLEGHTDYVRSVAFSPDGRHLASGSDDKAIRIRDTKNGQMVGDPLHGHTDYVFSVSYSRDGTRLASSSRDRTIRVWDPQTGQTVLGPLEAHSNWVHSVSFSPDGAFIASGSDDRTIGVYDAQTGQPVLGLLHGHTARVNSVIFSPDGARLSSCSDDGTIRLWNVQDRDVPTTSHAAVPSGLASVRYWPGGLRAVSGSEDGTVGVWDVQTGEMVLGPLEGHTASVRAVDCSPDGVYIASVSYDSTLRIWSAQDGQYMHGPLQGHTGWVLCVRFSPDSSLVVSGSADKTVRVWDVKTGQPVAAPLQGHSDWVRSVAFSPNGSHVASGSDDRTIRVWNIQTGQTVTDPLHGHEGRVMSVEFSPDGSRILSGSWDRSIRTWDALTGQPLLIFGKDREIIWSAGFSPDSRLVVSGSSDRTVCVWDAQSGDLILALEGHTDRVLSVQFSPDGLHVVSSSLDGAIRFWDVSSCRAYLEDESTKDDGETKGSNQVAAIPSPWSLRNNGWVVDRQGQRLVWVPSDLQNYIQHPMNRLVIGDERYVKLELEDTNIGDRWTRCYSP